MTALLRSITLFTALALLLFVGLHAIVPHDHPHMDGTHWSELPPFAHAENKIFVLVLSIFLLPILCDLISRMLTIFAEAYSILYGRGSSVVAAIPLRYEDALRKGRIHSRADRQSFGGCLIAF